MKISKDKKFPNRYNDCALLTYEEIMKSKDREKWITAIQEEKNSLDENKTWELVNANEPREKKCITSR